MGVSLGSRRLRNRLEIGVVVRRKFFIERKIGIDIRCGIYRNPSVLGKPRTACVSASGKLLAGWISAIPILIQGF